ncbi:MAG: hypothetical protein K0S23_3373 [Fluviicola sp.]|jgi:hypothetical protein|uniref:WG repeat-containing protein n=1 Tax=Fluviicola sp. TaxID=1917219 RepID=UPI0026027FF9|nr:WG repeat-containing protein [Fluviicola sp.]MDF3029066.1 hypothetical protein [Fluviicola sp.]
MKTSYCIILLFLCFNGFAQDSIRFSVNGKVGLKYKSGTLIVEPKYTDLKIEPDGIRLYDSEFQGYLPKGSNEIIPTNYTEISQIGSYFEARNESGRIDLYLGSKLIAGDLDTGLQMTDILSAKGWVIIRKEEKAGIIDQKGTIILPMEYSGIEAVSSFQYWLNDSSLVNYILVLDKSEYFYSPESEGFLLYGEPVLYLAKADGTLITDSVFTEVSYNAELDEFSLRCNNKLAFMKSGFRIDYLPYESISEFMEWKICSTGEESILFNRFNTAIDTFHSVIIPERRVVYTDPEEYELLYYVETIYEEFVYVTRNNGDTSQMAIYDLRNQQLVSNWEQGVTFVRKGKSASGPVVWVYMNEWGKMAYRISTAEKGSSFVYQDIYPVTDQFYALRKEGDPFYMLCELIGDSVFKERVEINKTFGSFNYTGINTQNVDEYDADLSHGFVDEFGNYYPYSTDSITKTVPILLIPFTVFQNAYGKLGFISWNGKVLDLNADTLFQNSMHSTLIEYKSGDLWGAAEVIWGNVFKPDQQVPERFRLMEDFALIYRLSEDEKHYIDSKGRFFYSTNPERMISKNGGLKGAKVYSEFEDKIDSAIPFVYREMLPAWNGNYLVQNKGKKWGILTPFNDTLFPFKYDLLSFESVKTDGIHEVFPYRDYDEVCYSTSGNFHGILSLNLRKEIPPVYDWVQSISESAFVVNKGGKYGVYDYNLDEKIKPVFDELMIGSSLSSVFILRAKKADKWYNIEFFEGKVPDQSTLLQTLPCDFVVDEMGFVKKQNGFEVRNLMDGSVVQKEGAITDYLSEKPLLVKDGKLYILDSKGKLLYPDALTNVVFMEDGTIMSSVSGITYSYSLSKKNKTVFTQ